MVFKAEGYGHDFSYPWRASAEILHQLSLGKTAQQTQQQVGSRRADSYRPEPVSERASLRWRKNSSPPPLWKPQFQPDFSIHEDSQAPPASAAFTMASVWCLSAPAAAAAPVVPAAPGPLGASPASVSLAQAAVPAARRRRRWDALVVCVAPDEEKITRRSPLDFPIEWEKPKPGRRPDIFPKFSPMKTPLPHPLPADDPLDDDEEEEEEEPQPQEEPQEDDPDKEEPEEDDPDKPTE
uniref:Uncharacterized protein n=1 Tax=Oryza punctata TaxID=4537 RepID=A0A0E0K2D5_ORYPU